MDTRTETGRGGKVLYRGVQVIWYILSVIEILLLLRFTLKLLEANSAAQFTSFIYKMSNVLTEPFRYVFATPVVEGSVFEWTTLLAMFVYWLIAMLLVHLLCLSRPISSEETTTKIEEEI